MNGEAKSGRWSHGLTALVAALLVGVVVMILRLWSALLVREYPLEYRESAMPLTTELLLRGRNPFAVCEQPGFANGYGILYHWAVCPLARLWGAGFGLHRFVSHLCLAGCALLWFCVLRKDGTPLLVAGACTGILLANLAFDVSSLARPDGLGLLLMLVTLGVPWRAGFSVRSVFPTALLALAAFYTKPYFLFGLAGVGSYLFLFVSMGRALLLACFFLVALAISAPVFRSLYPCYFTNTIFAQLGDLPCDWQHLLRHGGRFAVLNAGVLFLLLLAVLARRRRNGAEDSQEACTGGRTGAEPETARRRRVFALAQPFLARPLWSYAGHLLILGTLVVLWMGRHTGQGLLYYRQLLLPFLLWTCAGGLRQWFRAERPSATMVVNIVLAFQLAVLLAYALHKGPRLWKDRTNEWKEIRHVVESNDEIYHDAPLAHLVFARGGKVWDNGHTYLAFFVRPGPRFWVPEGYLEVVEAHLREGAVKIANRDFDCLALTPLNDGFFDARAAAGSGYRLTKKLLLPLPFNSDAVRLSIYERVVEKR